MPRRNQLQKSYIPLSGKQVGADDEFDILSLRVYDDLPTQDLSSFKKTNSHIAESLLNYLRILVVFLAAILFLAASTTLFRHQIHARASSEICQTEACQRAAYELRQAIGSNSSKVNPCVDFATHSCVGWNALHNLTEDQGNMFTGTLIQEQSDRLMRQILEDYQLPFHNSTHDQIDKRNLKKLRKSYAVCMNEEVLKEKGIAPLAQLVQQLDTFFQPLGNDSSIPRYHKNTSFDKISPEHLTKALSFLYKLEVNALLDIDVAAEPQNPHSMVPLLKTALQKDWPSRSHYQDESFVKNYTGAVAAVIERLPFQLAELGSTSTSLVPELALAQSIVGFEANIARAALKINNSTDYSRMSLDEAQGILPIINIHDLISDMGPTYTPDAVMVISRDYLLFISELVNRSDRWVVQSYLSWKLIQRFYGFIQSDSVKPLHDFSKRLTGKNPDYTPERWRICVHHVVDSLDGIISRFYIERAFSESKKTHAEEIVANIKNIFGDMIKNTEWMSEPTRIQSIEKLNLMVSKIGYSSHNPDLQNASSVYDYYALLPVSPTSYFTNVVSTSRFKTTRNWQLIGASQEPYHGWDRTTTSFNAYYNREHNEIVIPAGFMQEPAFYGPEVPSYFTYGAFGAIVGHEISHAFDSTGRHFDPFGAHTDWWDTGSAAEFDNRTQCFVKQYGEFNIPGDEANPSISFFVNGHLTLDENLADHSGLHAAFAAYQAHESLYPSKLLPGLEAYSREQLFFLVYGRYWCEKNKRELLLWRLQNDVHAPNFARVQGAVANEPGFGTAWKCNGERKLDDVETQWVPRCKFW